MLKRDGMSIGKKIDVPFLYLGQNRYLSIDKNML